jgi:hypothetical protein
VIGKNFCVMQGVMHSDSRRTPQDKGKENNSSCILASDGILDGGDGGWKTGGFG